MVIPEWLWTKDALIKELMRQRRHHEQMLENLNQRIFILQKKGE